MSSKSSPENVLDIKTLKAASSTRHDTHRSTKVLVTNSNQKETVQQTNNDSDVIDPTSNNEMEESVVTSNIHYNQNINCFNEALNSATGENENKVLSANNQMQESVATGNIHNSQNLNNHNEVLNSATGQKVNKVQDFEQQMKVSVVTSNIPNSQNLNNHNEVLNSATGQKVQDVEQNFDNSHVINSSSLEVPMTAAESTLTASFDPDHHSSILRDSSSVTGTQLLNATQLQAEVNTSNQSNSFSAGTGVPAATSTLLTAAHKPLLTAETHSFLRHSSSAAGTQLLTATQLQAEVHTSNQSKSLSAVTDIPTATSTLLTAAHKPPLSAETYQTAVEHPKKPAVVPKMPADSHQTMGNSKHERSVLQNEKAAQLEESYSGDTSQLDKTSVANSSCINCSNASKLEAESTVATSDSIYRKTADVRDLTKANLRSTLEKVATSNRTVGKENKMFESEKKMFESAPAIFVWTQKCQTCGHGTLKSKAMFYFFIIVTIGI